MAADGDVAGGAMGGAKPAAVAINPAVINPVSMDEVAADEYAGRDELREVVLTQHRQLGGLHQQVEDLNLLIAALQRLLDDDDDVDPFAGVFQVLRPRFRFAHAVALVLDDADAGLECVASTEPSVVGTKWPRHGRLNKILAGRVIATVDASPDAVWPSEIAGTTLDPRQPGLYLPLAFRARRGVLLLARDVGAEGFDRRDVAVARRLSLLASQAFATRQANSVAREGRDLRRLADELREARDTLDYRANHDELTGLANRRYFECRVNAAISDADTETRLAVLFIDLDGFKQVNDNYGHAVGDRLLVAVGERIRKYVYDDNDVVARISGDEFMVMASIETDIDGVMAVIERGLAEVRSPLALGDGSLMGSASVGVALFPEHGRSFDELRRCADMAMYRAKSTVRGTAALYTDEIGEAAAQRSIQEQDLRHAVAQRRFRAMLQPKVCLRSGQIDGFEVLARQVDTDGVVGGSASFITAASDLGLLDELVDVVVDDLLAHLPELDAAYGPDTSISVNLSTRQATDRARVDSLLARLGSTGRADRFVIEVTEDALLESDYFEQQIMPILSRAGVRLSIDDFGAGYATLSRLLSMTADEIKIDRSFIAGIDGRRRNQVILHAIDTIAEELGARIVAEGVETRQELDFLRFRSRVHVAQGFLFARPALPERLIAERPNLLARIECLLTGTADVAPPPGIDRRVADVI